MFKRTGEKSRFDSVSLVELRATIWPDGAIQHISAKLCYVDSSTGTTYGSVDLVHVPMDGKEILSQEALDAWTKFREVLEKQQGMVLFGRGTNIGWDAPASEDEPLNEGENGPLHIGLGGGT